MASWLKCKIFAGQFPVEYGIEGIQHDDSPFSLYVPKDIVNVEKEPLEGLAGSGTILVDVLDENDKLALVKLPRATFQGGPYVTVKRSCILTRATPKAKKSAKASR